MTENEPFHVRRYNSADTIEVDKMYRTDTMETKIQ